MQIGAFQFQIPNVLAASIGSGAVDRTPASGVSVIPCGEALTHTDFYDLSRGCVCRASRVPEEEDGGPGPGVLVLEVSACTQQKADYGDVADEEGTVQRASVASSGTCKSFGSGHAPFKSSKW